MKVSMVLRRTACGKPKTGARPAILAISENHLITLNSTSGYKYDGEGRRVRKLIGENTRFVYGISEELVAEFNGSTGNLKKENVQGGGTLITIEPTAVNSNGTRYTTSDNLGSPRVVTNSSASVVSRHDYMPFGEELGAGTGGRTTGMGFSVTDGLRQKFTSKERDSETGLDYFGARYYGCTQGRFTSTDPLLASARPSRPQSWNRYAYVLNNPLKLVDPSGMSEQRPGLPSADLSGGGGGSFAALLNQQREWVAISVEAFVEDVTQETVATTPEANSTEPQQVPQSQPEGPQNTLSSQGAPDPSITPCNISVQFGSVQASETMNRTGLYFTVEASAPSGGISRLRKGDGGARHGAWSFQQLTWQRQTFVGNFGSRGPIDYDTSEDNLQPGNYSIRGNKMRWVDVPGIPLADVKLGALVHGESYSNVTIRGWTKGKLSCELQFGIHFTYDNGKGTATVSQTPF